MKINRKRLTTAISGLVLAASLSGCELAYKKQVKEFINENISDCGGKIESLALVQDGPNKLTGLVAVSVDGEDYKTTITVKTGIEDSIISMEEDICAMHIVRTGFKALQDIFK